MRLQRLLALTAVAWTAVVASGCGDKAAAPFEVNDENCKPENVVEISDRAQREDFAGKCARRGEFKASQPKTW